MVDARFEISIGNFVVSVTMVLHYLVISGSRAPAVVLLRSNSDSTNLGKGSVFIANTNAFGESIDMQMLRGADNVLICRV